MNIRFVFNTKVHTLFFVFFIFFSLGTQVCFSLSPNEEIKIGKEIYESLQKQNQLLNDSKVSNYVTKVGNRVLNQSNQPLPYNFRFSIVNSSAINAFATPGGYVYINKGLITIIEDEDELAGVLAHEIAHVTCRHIAQQYEKSKKLNIATLAAVLAGAILGGGAGGADAAIVSIAAAGALQLKYSRDNEEEADRIGLLSLVNSGYDGQGMMNLLKVMKSYEFYSNTIPSYFLTHPGTDDRIHYIDSLLQTRYKKKGTKNIIGGLPRIQTLLLLSDKDTDAAQKQFGLRLKKNPDNLDALYGLALVQGRLGKINESMQLLTRALDLAPDDIDILRAIGVGYYQLGKMSQAVDYLRKAYAIDDNDEETLLYLARAYEETGDNRTALRLYLDLSKANPDNSNFYYNLGMNYGKLGNQGESHFYFGIFNKKKSKPETALYHFKEALKYFPAESIRYSDTQKEIDEVTPKKKPRELTNPKEH